MSNTRKTQSGMVIGPKGSAVFAKTIQRHFRNSMTKKRLLPTPLPPPPSNPILKSEYSWQNRMVENWSKAEGSKKSKEKKRKSKRKGTGPGTKGGSRKRKNIKRKTKKRINKLKI